MCQQARAAESTSQLELITRGQLDVARIPRLADDSEISGADVPDVRTVDCIEFGVIERIQETGPNFERVIFSDAKLLKRVQIPILKTRTVEHVASEGSQPAGTGRECVSRPHSAEVRIGRARSAAAAGAVEIGIRPARYRAYGAGIEELDGPTDVVGMLRGIVHSAEAAIRSLHDVDG